MRGVLAPDRGCPQLVRLAQRSLQRHGLRLNEGDVFGVEAVFAIQLLVTKSTRDKGLSRSWMRGRTDRAPRPMGASSGLPTQLVRLDLVEARRRRRLDVPARQAADHSGRTSGARDLLNRRPAKSNTASGTARRAPPSAPEPMRRRRRDEDVAAERPAGHAGTPDRLAVARGSASSRRSAAV